MTLEFGDSNYTVGFAKIGATKVTGIMNVDTDLGAQHQTVTAPASISPRYMTMISGAPKIGFGMVALENLFAAIMGGGSGGSTAVLRGGTPISSAGTGIFSAQWAKCEELSDAVYSAIADHPIHTVNYGFLQLQSLSVQQDSLAAAQMLLHCLWDGVNDPVEFSDGALVIPGVADEETTFSLGPIVLNGNPVGQVQGFTYNPNLPFVPERFSGETFARKGDVKRGVTTISIQLKTPVPMRQFGLTNLSTITSTADLYLIAQTKNAGKQPTGDGNAHHIKCQVNAGTLSASPVKGSIGTDMTNQLTLSVMDNNGAAELAWANEQVVPDSAWPMNA